MSEEFLLGKIEQLTEEKDSLRFELDGLELMRQRHNQELLDRIKELEEAVELFRSAFNLRGDGQHAKANRLYEAALQRAGVTS